MLEEGAGVQANPREALYWYREAAKNGDSDAAERARALSAQVEPAGAPDGR
jgi:TPR repeat protein